MLSISTEIIKRGYRVLKRNFSKKTNFNHNDVVRNNVNWGSFVEKFLSLVNAKNIKLVGAKDEVKVEISFDNESIVQYRFKYDKDGLLLLRGVAIKKGSKFKYMITPHSIPDVAISARPLESECKMVWVPSHGTIKNVADNITLAIVVDGKLLTETDDFAIESVGNVKIMQTFEAYNPNEPFSQMWEHSIKHEIDRSAPFCEISNTIEIVTNTEIRDMYLTMLPADSSNVSKLLLNDGTEYNSIATDGTDLDEGSNVTSAMYLMQSTDGSTDDVIAVDNTSSVGEDDFPARVTFRTDNVSKFYLNHFSGIAKKGTTFNGTQRLICLSGIKAYNN